MRKSFFAPLIALLILAIGVSSVSAVVVTNIDRQCIDDTSGGRFITGSVTVEAGSFEDGDILTLTLSGKRTGDPVALQTETITLVDGQLTYDFTFENVPTANGSGELWQSYIITTDAENPEQAESIDVEVECRPGVIPEAPLVILLLGTAGVLTTWFVVRRMRPASSMTPAV